MKGGEIELRQLRIFLAVIDVAGYSRAAVTLGLSQSTVSETVASLERTLGIPLLRREGRRIVPTESGEVLRGYAQRIVALTAEATARTSMSFDDAKPELVIGAVDSVGSYLLPVAIAQLREVFPGARTTIRVGDCHDIRGWLQAGAVEVGLMVEPTRARAPAGGATVLGHSPLVLCGRPRTGAFGVQHLRRHSVHMAGKEGLYQAAFRACLRRAGVPMPPLHAGGSIEGVKRAVLSSSDAVCVLPAFAIAGELERGELQVLRLDPPLPLLRIAAQWQGGKAAPPRTLVTTLLSLLRKAPSVDQSKPTRVS